MVLRRRISYQWRMFLPLVSALWLMLICMGLWTFYNNRNYKEARSREQLDLVNSRVLAFYDDESGESNIRPYLRFVYDYYYSSPLYDRIRISVYEDHKLVQAYGEPIELTSEELDSESGITSSPGVTTSPMIEIDSDNSRNFYYKANTSSDGRATVITVLPMDGDVSEAIRPAIGVFVGLFLVALTITIIAFFFTRHFGKNIKLLRSFAEKAASDPNFLPATDFPHDELGDINRQIVHMYNERSKAVQKQKREHAVAMHAIEEKSRAKRQLSNNINHELRTPIGVIKGYLDTIIENPDMDGNTRTHFIKKAQEHANRLVTLIADVSVITRLEEGGELISTEELDFHDVAFTISNDIEESGVLGSMSFNFDVPLDCKINGNYNLLTGMLMNLARNAAAYSKGDMCELICTGEDKAFYSFAFRDNGKGVGEEHIPHLFDRFYRVDSGRARKAGGTGLGLPIVQSTVIAHGGTITVENRPEGGLCFRFKLPKAKNK